MYRFQFRRGVWAAAVGCALAAGASSAQEGIAFSTSVDPAGLPQKKQTTLGLYLAASDVSGFRTTHPGVVLIDVRTRAEAAFVGIAADADRNIPYMVMDEFWDFNEAKGTYAMVVNSEFAGQVEETLSARGLGKDTPIILICRSGSRSARAADLLAQLGYTTVFSVVDGFEGDKSANGIRNVNGWKNAGLRWSYKIRADQAY